MERTFLLFIALVAGTYAGPISEIAVGQQCAKQCSVSSKFNYEAGTTYEFKYENEIRTSVNGASEDHAGLFMSATVNIDFISKCEAVMRLSDVTMKEHDPESSQMKVVSADLKSLLEKDPLGFSFQDGSIEQLCLANSQDVKVLNIKRGILSMFQNNMDDISQEQTVQESDVAGTCDTEYKSADKGWYNVVVKKSKNMLTCTNRHDATTALSGMPYDSHSKIQSLPIVKSTHNCEQELVKESGRLVSVSCKEQHTFAPFSRNGAGAATVNTQDLTFVKQSKTRSKPVAATTTTGLHYDHQTSSKLTNTLQDLENKLQEVCESTANGVQHDTPKMFTSLIYTLKKMRASEMSTVFQSIKTKKTCVKNNERVRKFFLDAIPMTGTPASLKLMTQLLVNEEVTGIEADMWLTTLAFIQNPTVDMLSEVKPLLTMKSNQEKAMLSVSSLVHSLCGNNPDCDNYMDVRKIISLLENKIAPSCKVTSKNMQTTLIALRAIGNAGYGTSAIKSLQKCIMQMSNPIEIRLSAIEAFRRMPCNADKSVILSVLTNMEEDSEVRIAAYKSLMECPSTDILKKVKLMLSREEVNQVGSYIWSHLTNLMETSDPHKQTIRTILQDETLKKEFDMDKRKFSRNYEGSFFLERLNTGATVESDLIWSSKSFIPRSAMLNLTVDLFGNAVNLFEVGGRIEGLEYFLEQYFGPNGYFSENDVQAAVDETAVQTIKSDKAQRINKRMGSAMDDLRGSLYMRVFGNELRYMNFEGIESLLLSNDFNILDILIKLSKNNDYQYSHSTMFMDSSLMVPTYSGFPMNLTVNGIATIDLKASGKVDVMKMASMPRGMDIQGTLRPSAALEVTSTMSVDAMVTKVGLKMVSSLYTSTAVQGKLSLADGNILDMEFDLPEEKMEVINVKSSFFTVHRDLEREQKMITENKRSHEVCSGKKLAKLSGLELCGEVSYPNASLVENAPYFPLTGPVSASVILYKRDTLTGYKLEARSTHTANSNIVRLAFSTPKSKIDRDFGVNFNLNKNDGTLDMSFDSPMKRANFAGNYQFTKKALGISGKLNVDNKVRYEVKLAVDAAKSGPGMVYTPTLVVEVPGKKLVDFRSTIKYAPWKLFDVDMSLGGIFKPPMKAQVTYMKKLKLTRLSLTFEPEKKQQYTFDASYQTIAFKKKVIYKPQISVRTPTAEVLAFGGSYTNIFGKVIKIDATLDKLTSKPIILKKAVFGVKQYNRGRKLYNTNLDFRSSPMDFKVKAKLDKRSMKQLATDVDLTYVIRKVARDNIKFASKIINFSSKTLTKLRLPMSFTSKLNSDYNMKMQANLDYSKKHSQIDAEISYGPNPKDENKQISLLVSLDKAIRNWSKASAEFIAKFRKGKDIRVVSELKHQHTPKALDSSMNLRLNKNAVTAALSLKDQSTTLKNYRGDFDLTIPGKTISVSQSIAETKPSEYTSTLTAKMGKMQNKVETSWKKASPSSLSLNATLDFYQMDTMTIKADYDIRPKVVTATGSIAKGTNKYSISSVSKMASDDAFETTAELQYPERKIVASFEQQKKNDIYTSLADLRWNADKDDSQRAVIKSKGRFVGLNDFEESFAVQYPSRNIAFNLKHFLGKKCVSHVDMQWEPNQVYSIDTIFGRYDNAGIDETEAQVKLATPFKALKALDVKLNQQVQKSEYKTSLDVEWNPKNIISTTLTLSRPVSLRSINAELVAKTPFTSFKTVQASLRHKVSPGLLTVGKVTWNKQSIQMDLSLDDASTERKTNMKGEVNIKTTFKNLKQAQLNIAHLMSGNKMQTSITAIRNKKEYGVATSLKHSLNGWNVNNNGEVKLYSPTEEYKATWDHVNTLNDITTSGDITWGKNKHVSIKYSGLQQFKDASGSLSSALEVKSSFKPLNDVVAQISHEHKPGQIETTFAITNEGTKVVSGECKYLRKNGNAKFSLVSSNPWTSSDATLSMTSSYESMPRTLHIDARFSPQIAMSLDGSFNYDSQTNVQSVLSLTSPLFDDVSLEGSRQVTPTGVQSVVSLRYAQKNIARITSTHGLKEDKFVKLGLQTPYTEPYSAEVGLKGGMDNFEARIEILPFLKKWTATGSFDRRTGASLKVNTPYPEVPYSQIAIKSERINGDRTSSIAVEYMPGKTISFTSTYNFENSKNMKLSCGIETPFKELPKSMFEFTHRGPMKQFVNHILVEYQPGQTVSMDTSVSSTNGLDATVIVTSPWTSTMKGALKLTGKVDDITAHGEFTWKSTNSFDVRHTGTLSAFSTAIKVTAGDSTTSGNIDFTNGPKTTTDINIRTPLKQWKSIKVVHSLEGSLKRFNNHLEVSTTKIGTYTSDINLDITTGINGDIAIQTPIQGYRNLKASLTHTGTLENFNSNVEVQSGSQKYSGDIKLATKPAVTFIIALKTPIKTYQFNQIKITHDGSSVDFKTNVEMQLNKDVSEIDISYNYAKKLNLDIAIRSPYIDPVKMSVDHWGKPTRFTSKIRAKSGKQKLSADLQFQLNPSLNAQIVLKTPFALLKNQQLSIKHAGSMDSFKCTMMYRCNSKIYNGDAMFQKDDTIKGEVNLKGPDFRPINLALSAAYAPQSYKSSVQASSGKKTIKLDASLDTKSGINGKVGFSSPIEGLESVTASVSHKGSLSNFKSEGAIACNKKRISVVAICDTSRDIVASLEVTTPFKNYGLMSSSLRHVGGINDFETTANYRLNKKTLELRATSTNDKTLSMGASLLSKFDNVPNMDASLTYKNLFNAKGDVTFGTTKADFEMNLNTLSNGYTGKLSASMPYIKRVTAEFNHQMSVDAINSDLQATYDGTSQLHVTSEVKKTNPLGLTITVNTPYENLETAIISLVYSKVKDSMTTEARLTLNDETHEGRMSITMSPSFDSSITMRSPLMKNVDVTMSADGHLLNFRSQFDAKYNRKSLLRSEFDLRLDGPIAGDLKILSPMMKNIKASFNHDGTLTNFKSDVAFVYAGQKTEGMLSINVVDGIQVSSKLSSPFSEDLDIAVTSRGNILNSVTSGDVMYAGKSKFSVNANLDLTGPIDTQVTIRTPYSQMSASLTHYGKLTDFKTAGELTLDDQKISMELSFNPESGMLLLKSPMLNDMQMSFSKSGNFPAIQSQANAMYGSTKLIDATFRMNFPTEGEIMIMTPTLMDKPVSALYKTAKKANAYDVHAELNINGEKHETDFSINTKGKLSASLNTPMFVPVTLNLNYESKPFMLSTQGEIAIGSDRHQYEFAADINDGIHSSILLRSSLMPELQVSLNANDDVRNLKATAEITYNSKDILDVTIDTESGDNSVASVSATILGKTMIAKMSTTGLTIRNMKNSVELTYNTKEILDINVYTETGETKVGGINVMVMGNTAHFKVSTTGSELRNMNNKVELTYNNQDIFDITLNVVEDNTLSVSLNGMVLGNTAEISTSLTGTNIYNMKTDAHLTFNKQEIFEIDAQTESVGKKALSVQAKLLGNVANVEFTFNGNSIKNINGNMKMSFNYYSLEGDAAFSTIRNIQGLVNFKSSFTRPVSATMNLDRSKGSYSSTGSITIDSDKHEYTIEIKTNKPIQATFEITSPLVKLINGRASFNGNLRNFNFDSSLTYGRSQSTIVAALNTNSGIRGSLEIMTPVTQPFKVSTALTGKMTDFNIDSSVTYGNSKSTLVGSLNIDSAIRGNIDVATPLTKPLKASLDLTDSNLDSSLTYGRSQSTIKASLNIDSAIRGNIDVATPLTKPLKASFDLTDLNLDSSLTYGRSQSTIKASLDLDSAIRGNIDVVTPFSESLKASFDLTGKLTAFNLDSSLAYGQSKSTIKAALNIDSAIRGNIDVVTPLTKPLTASIDLTGKLTNFNFDSSLTYGRSQSTIKAAMNIETAISGNIDIVTPLFEPIRASFEQTGRISNFKTVAKATYGEDQLFNSEITFSTNPLQGKLQLQSMIPGYENIIALFRHNGEMLAFTNHAELDLAGEKTELDISFNAASKLEGRISSNSPYYPSISTGFGLKGTMMKFDFTADASIASDQYSAELSMDTTRGIQSSMKLQSPFKGYKQITGKLSHSGVFPNIMSSVALKSGRRNLALGSLQMSTNNGYSMKMSLQTILTPTIQINLGHKGTLSKFESVGEIRYNGQPSTLNVAFTTMPSLEGTYTLSTPWKTSSGKLNFEKKTNGLDMNAETRLDDQAISINMAYQGGNNMGMTFTVQTPFENFDHLKGVATFNKRYNGFNAQAEIELPSRKSIELEAQLRGLTGKIALKTPFDGLKYSSIETKYNGQLPNVVSGLTINILNKVYAINARLDGFNGNIEVTTPFKGFETTAITFTKQGPLTDMQASLSVNAMNKKVMLSCENKLTSNSLTSKARLETPETDDLVFELSHTGSMFNFVNYITLSMGTANSLTSSTNFKLDNTDLDIDATLSTTLVGTSDEQKLKLNFEESFPNYKVSSFVKLFGSEYTLESSLDTTSNIIGKLALTTPFQGLNDLSLDVEHSGTYRRFETRASAEMNSEKVSGELTYMKYGWRRLHTSLEVQTTFEGMENSKLSYRHTATSDSFECNADANVFRQDYTGNIRASMKPMKAQITFTTPFSGFQQIGADMKVDFGTDLYLTEVNLSYMQDKTISLTSEINLKDSPKLFHVKLNTPFSGYENTEARITHSGDYKNFQSIATISTPFTPALRTQMNLRSSSMSNFDGSLMFNSQIRNLETIKLSLKNEYNLGKYTTNLETSWAPSKTITLTSVLRDYTNSMGADITLSTPFEEVSQLSINAQSKANKNQYTNSLIIKHNQETCIDMDVDVDITRQTPSAVVTLREPTPLRVELGMDIGSMQYAGKFLLNKDLKVEASHDKSTRQTMMKYETPKNTVLLKHQPGPGSCKSDLYVNNYHYGYDMSMTKTDGSLKVILPSRSLKISGLNRNARTEGAFMWDADRDQSKMVGFNAELTRLADSMKADVTLQMPSLGKDVHIDSEMILNRGKVLFEGKTDFTYSKDSRKTITLTSKLMDISDHWSTKNYSFSLGLQHPYTTVGVQVNSHLGKSKTEYTGGFDLEYLTARRETKTFSVNGEINKLRQSAYLKVNTPLKKISIAGDAKMQDPFSVSIIRQFDNRRPMRTSVTLDTKNKKVAFETNYDLNNPNSEFHVSAKYLNNSAILSEVAHVVNRQKVTDALMFLRLNNSHLLHSRVHWRPAAIDDLKVLLSKKGTEYATELAQLSKVISTSVRQEALMKLSAIKKSVAEEMEPFVEQAIVMYERNDYHVRDVTDEIIRVSKMAESRLEAMAKRAGKQMDKLNNMVNAQAESVYVALDDISKKMVAGAMIKLEPLYNMTQHPSVLGWRQQAHRHYSSYMQQLSGLPNTVSSMANTYTAAIYGARENVNANMYSLLGRDDVKYARTYADPILYQGQNAYKYWEVRENVEMLVDAVVDMIKSEIEKELSDLKASLFSLTKTTFTVYDPAHGEIQADIHLPIPLRSLDEIPAIDIAPYVTKVQQYQDKMPRLPQISTDVSTWLPPYDAYATIQGNKVTTFDGSQYEVDASCSYLLARDFVDGNFSLVLHKQDNTKSILIMADGKAITIREDGKVLVNEKPVETPAMLKNITITSVDKVLTVVKGAGSFEVSYSPVSDLITVKLNGWYFGKTSGLFGTYDNEPHNDFLSSYGRPISNAARFARTWDMSLTKCR